MTTGPRAAHLAAGQQHEPDAHALRLCWHFDFHSHREVRIGHDPDPEGVAAALAGAGVSEIITFAKGHCGFTYYPTEVPTCYRHPKMVGDPFGDIVRACTARGVRVLAYISFGIDGEGARHNPRWMQAGSTGPRPTPDWFISVCPYTPYTDECVLPQLDEICRRYPVSGFFFDTMGALGACYCEYCQRDFAAASGGLAIPREPQDPNWGTYGHFRHDRGMALLDRISSFIQQRLPGAAVGFNQVGSMPYPEPPPAGCTRLTLDYQTYGPQSRMASLCAAYGSNSPTPADVMPTIFTGGWGDWSPAPAQRHEQIAAAVWARRCTLYMGDRLHPANRLAAPSPRAMAQVGQLRQRFAVEFPPAASRLAPDAVILHARSMQYGADMAHFALDARVRHRTLEGAAGLLLDTGANYTVAGEHMLEAALHGASLVVVPEIQSIELPSAATLHQFADAGGQVLFIGSVPTVDGRQLDWAGVTHNSKPWQDHVYLPPLDKADPDPVLVRGDTVALAPQQGTQVLQRAIAPLDMRHGVRFGWGIAPPSDGPSEYAGLTRRTVGERGGAAWCLAGAWALNYQQMGDWRQVRHWASLVQRVLPAPRARLDSPHGQVELVLHTDDQAWWAFLINHGGETVHGINNRLQWTRIWGPLPVYRPSLILRSPTGKPPRAVIAGGKPLRFTWSARRGEARVRLRMDSIWRIVRVEW